MSDPKPVAAGFRLADVDPSSSPGVKSRKDAARQQDEVANELEGLQERLFADGTVGQPKSVLLVIQAMDTAGKGGIVRHVVGNFDPQGVHLHAFKTPTDEEKAHDFLWRVRAQLPTPGIVGVFDRSHYEDVLIGRVHELAPPEVLEARYGQIVDFEREVVAAGTRIVKVMLHISPEEQGDRLLRRLERADKRWKYNPSDVDERASWHEYMAAYDLAITRTSTPDAPWYVVPANHKWYSRWAVQRIMLQTLRGINPTWPPVDYDVEGEKARLAATSPQ